MLTQLRSIICVIFYNVQLGIGSLLLKIKLTYSDEKSIIFIQNMYELFSLMVLGSNI